MNGQRCLQKLRFSLQEYGTGNRQEFLADCRTGKYDKVHAIYRSNESTKVTGPFDEELVSALPEAMKYICHNGAGYDNIDIGACSRRGISVANTPIAVNNATADIAMWLIIGALRRITAPLLSIRAGKWRGRNELGRDPQNKVLGILGMGGIGSELAIRARSFGLKIIYHNRHELPPSHPLAGSATYVSFADLLAQSDIISLNLSLNANTRHIISSREFAVMKDGVMIINTARGALIDEKALVEALKSGKVWSAGLDVFEEEPVVQQELLENENVVLLPHVGTGTVETQAEMERLTLRNLKTALFEKKLVTQVPEQRVNGQVNEKGAQL